MGGGGGGKNRPANYMKRKIPSTGNLCPFKFSVEKQGRLGDVSQFPQFSPREEPWTMMQDSVSALHKLSVVSLDWSFIFLKPWFFFIK